MMHCTIPARTGSPRGARIIAAIIGGAMLTGAAASPEPYAGYSVRLELVRNGVFLGAPEAVLPAGTALPVDVAAGSGSLRVMQRVTPFPGDGRGKALLELEILSGRPGITPKRLAAPILGVPLDRSQTYDLSTEQGKFSIRATVRGLRESREGSAAGLETFAYPEI